MIRKAINPEKLFPLPEIVLDVMVFAIHSHEVDKEHQSLDVLKAKPDETFVIFTVIPSPILRGRAGSL